MAIKVEDVYNDMDKLIEAYTLQGRAVPVLRLTPEQWERMSNDFQRAIKKNIHEHPVENRGGRPFYKGYELVRHTS